MFQRLLDASAEAVSQILVVDPMAKIVDQKVALAAVGIGESSKIVSCFCAFSSQQRRIVHFAQFDIDRLLGNAPHQVPQCTDEPPVPVCLYHSAFALLTFFVRSRSRRSLPKCVIVKIVLRAARVVLSTRVATNARRVRRDLI